MGVAPAIVPVRFSRGDKRDPHALGGTRMPRFNYKALNDSGQMVTGLLEADSAEAANASLAARGFIPSEVVAEGEKGGRFGLGRLQRALAPVRVPDLIIFTKQFRTLLKAGVSMMRILRVLEQQAENVNLRRVIADIARDIEEGSRLHDAFAKHPKVFSPLYCGMVQAGESSGALSEVLDRLVYIITHEHKVKSDIKAAMTYPIIVVIFLVLAFFILLTWVIPRFVTIFERSNIDLPLPTVICMGMYRILSDYGPFLLVGAVGAAVGLFYYLRTENGRMLRDMLILRLPVVGPLILKSAMSRFASIFAILQASGVGILESMRILADTIGIAPIARRFESITERLEQGRGMAEPLRQAGYFPPIVINMIAIGEEAGNLELMLGEIAEHYDVEVEYAMKKLADAIGPVLTVGLAAVVGFFALAIFLPMWDLTKMVN